MNVTAFVVGMAVALGYYFFSRRKARSTTAAPDDAEGRGSGNP